MHETVWRTEVLAWVSVQSNSPWSRGGLADPQRPYVHTQKTAGARLGLQHQRRDGGVPEVASQSGLGIWVAGWTMTCSKPGRVSDPLEVAAQGSERRLQAPDSEKG